MHATLALAPQQHPFFMPKWLQEVEEAHPFQADKYLRKISTIDDLRHNCSILGISHLGYVRLAESAQLPHEYDDELDRVDTSDEGYLLLKKLHERELTKTRVYANVVVRLGELAQDMGELKSLHHAVAWNPKLARLVAFFDRLMAMKERS
jgi:hypothetical protein